MENNKITSLLRIRNEELIIEDTLRHLSNFSDEIYVYDDCSQDNTVKICEQHPLVKKVIRNFFHNEDQTFVQTAQRKLLLDYAKADSKNKWFGYFDCDERIEFDFSRLEQYNKDKVVMIYLRLFDAYLTKDNQRDYKQGDVLEKSRKYFGPEFREVGFLFDKNKVDYDLQVAACRQPYANGKTIIDGCCKHYGKAVSIKIFNETVDYYCKSMPMLKEKWEKRRGKAVHIESDFGRKLYTWDKLMKDKKLWVKI